MSDDTITDRRWRRRIAALAVIALAVTGAACANPTPTASSLSSSRVVARDLEGKRYCEVLLVHAAPAGLTADVYNTYPLNTCPQNQWAAMDGKAIATENQVPFALLNGPRFWLMNSIAKVRAGGQVVTTFGGMAMIKEATVGLGTSVAAAMVPFTPHTVNRQASFTFDAGRQVYELVDPGGAAWVMQTFSQGRDPSLTRADLPGLAPRLTLPAGWTYRARTVTAPLVVATTRTSAHVLQDNFQNSYSEETGG